MVEHEVEFLCCLLIKNDSIFLIVEPQAPGIEVCTAYGAETSIHRHDFGVVEARFVKLHLCTLLLQFPGIAEHHFRSKGNVAFG